MHARTHARGSTSTDLVKTELKQQKMIYAMYDIDMQYLSYTAVKHIVYFDVIANTDDSKMHDNWIILFS